MHEFITKIDNMYFGQYKINGIRHELALKKKKRNKWEMELEM